ncbi:glutathione S-transferase family protein [Neptunomonas japonica]|uniref:Glutathione S-transferase n=1 Tax=Neptunomonas japonica JAMM 1380 TaxID=1441457 RepID=A0A7R6P9J3_9GAMM|nr:glutathione S-transferase family protein [Neptunomonas japonica]BBB29748.1 glutathione S-transferase [Neptunomonas japonica JAMM 1380]
MLIDGQWAEDFQPVQKKDAKGGFVRQPSQFRNWITPTGDAGPTGSAGFKAETGRYHLYVAYICPWASRTLMVRKLKKLEGVVSVSILNPKLTDKVWAFNGYPEAGSDPLFADDYLYQTYLRADKYYTGRITVPVLWDKQLNTIVSNESSEIIRMLNNGFGGLADNSINLYPLLLRDEIEQVNERLYHSFNNGVYRAGFATSQEAYEEACKEVFSSLDYIESRLATQPYIVESVLTEADIRLFVTLIRFDLVYHGLFKTNLKQIKDYPFTYAYMLKVYRLPGIAETVNIDHIKAGYYSIKALNPTGIVPLGLGNII